MPKTYSRNTSKTVSAAENAELRFGVVFGTPSRHCDGSGVCIIARVPVLERWSIPCAFVVAFFSIWEDGHFVFRVPVQEMTDPLYQQHFSNGFFLVEEAFEVPRWMAKALGEIKIAVPAGVYRVEQRASNYLIHFNLLQNN
jgi:hypothetical protein